MKTAFEETLMLFFFYRATTFLRETFIYNPTH